MKRISTEYEMRFLLGRAAVLFLLMLFVLMTVPKVVNAGSQTFNSSGTFIVQDYVSLTVTVNGAGSGGRGGNGGTGGKGGTGGTAYDGSGYCTVAGDAGTVGSAGSSGATGSAGGNTTFASVTPVVGNGATTGAAGTASGGDTNTTGGGATGGTAGGAGGGGAGGAGGIGGHDGYYNFCSSGADGTNGGSGSAGSAGYAGGQAIKTWVPTDPGAPVQGVSISVTIGTGGTGGNGGAGGAGAQSLPPEAVHAGDGATGAIGTTGGTAGTGTNGSVAITWVDPFVHTSITLTKNVAVTGGASVIGALSKGSGTFVIDHPLDPKNKLLYHSFVESPDVLNIYDGLATLDNKGRATVELPQYFFALNKDFQYLATPIGSPMPKLYLSAVAHYRFWLFGKIVLSIAGGAPNGKVSWQITGIRHDPFITARPIIPIVEKGPGQLVDKGEYLFPEFYAK